MSTQGNAILMGTTGPVAGSKYELRPEGAFIGLDAQKRVIVTPDSRQLSVTYARITAAGDAYQLEAVGGGGSVTVDGSQVRGSVPLSRLHAIGVGQGVEFVFRRSAPAAAAQPAPVVTPAAAPPPPPHPPTPPATPAPPQQKNVTAPRTVTPPLQGGTVVDGGALSALPSINRNAPPAGTPASNVSTDPTNPLKPPLGTMIDSVGLGEITDPRQRKVGTPAAGPAPGASPPAPPAPPATPAGPAKPLPLGTMVDAAGLGEITDPRQRQRQFPPASPPPAPTPPAPSPPEPSAPRVSPSVASAPTPPARPAIPPPPGAPVPRAIANDATNVISAAGRPGDPSPYEIMCALPDLGMQTYRLKFGDNVVGRSDECDIQVPDNEKVLSRKHAIIKVAVDKVEIVDLKGQNGTYVKGKRVDTAPLVVGSSFHLGPIKFALLKA